MRGQDKVFDHGPNRVFVFGSNRAGYHGGGAAKYAREHCGAIQGLGEGLQGNSYALPTKDRAISTLPLEEISIHVERFKAFARTRPDLSFFVTRVGCGLAGYTDDVIAPMFAECPDNVELPEGWP